MWFHVDESGSQQTTVRTRIQGRTNLTGSIVSQRIGITPARRESNLVSWDWRERRLLSKSSPVWYRPYHWCSDKQQKLKQCRAISGDSGPLEIHSWRGCLSFTGFSVYLAGSLPCRLSNQDWASGGVVSTEDSIIRWPVLPRCRVSVCYAGPTSRQHSFWFWCAARGIKTRNRRLKPRGVFLHLRGRYPVFLRVFFNLVTIILGGTRMPSSGFVFNHL